MSRTTLSQYKEMLQSEAAEINKLMDRRQSNPEKAKRLEQIEKELEIIAGIEKPDSIFKKVLNQK